MAQLIHARGRDATQVSNELQKAFERIENSGADPTLIRLVKSCIAVDLIDRPKTPAELLERVEGYLTSAQKKIQCFQEAHLREVSRLRTIVWSCVAVVVFSSLAISRFHYHERKLAEQAAKTTRLVEHALSDAQGLLIVAQTLPKHDLAVWDKVLVAARHAESLLPRKSRELELRHRIYSVINQATRERKSVLKFIERAEADQRLLDDLESVRSLAVDADRANRDYYIAFRRSGLDFDTTKPDECAKWLLERSESVAVLLYLDDWVRRLEVCDRLGVRQERIEATIDLADLDPWRKTIRHMVSTNEDGDFTSIREFAENRVELDRQPAINLVALARALRSRAGDIEGADRVLQRARTRFPADFWVYLEAAATELHPNAPGKIDADRQAAIRYLMTASALRPRSFVSFRLLSRVMSEESLTEEAIGALTNLVKLAPEVPEFHHDLGIELMTLGKYTEAFAEFHVALELNPRFVEAYSSRADALVKLDKTEEAIAMLREAAAIEPDRAGFHKRIAWLMLTAPNPELRGSREALEAARLAVELDLSAPDGFLTLALAEYRADHLDQAYAAARACGEIPSETDSRGGFILTMIYIKQGKRDEARLVYKQAVKTAENQPRSRDLEALQAEAAESLGYLASAVVAK